MRFAPVLMCALVIGALAPSVAHATQIVVGFDDAVTDASQSQELRQHARTTASTDVRGIDARVIDVPSNQVQAVLARLRAQGEVRYAQVDAPVRAAWTPNDSYFTAQWGLAKIGAATAWNTARGSGVLIANVDSGVDYRHPDLAGKVALGYDFVGKDNDPMDEYGHGTHVAGIIAAGTNNGIGVAGLAPSSRLLAVRVLDAKGSGTMSGAASGIMYAVDVGAKVINLSLTAPTGAQVLLDAINYAVSKGVIVTCAAGNQGAAALAYPAAYDGCVAVGATTETDARAGFSNYGTGLDVVAPGTNIYSTVLGAKYGYLSGTSMAAPSVAGLAALLMSRGLNRAAVLSTITRTAIDLGTPGYDTTFGAGRIDAAAAVASTVAPANAIPKCATTGGWMRRNTGATVPLTCTDANGDKLTMSIMSLPRRGTLSNFDAAKGTVVYRPAANFTGTDSFTFRASDGKAISATATFTITVV